MTKLIRLEEAMTVIARIVDVAATIAFQAGVGGMETAGSIISYLANHPEQIDGFLSGEVSVLDWPINWHEQGILSWHGQDGKIYHPEFARRARTIRSLAQHKGDSNG